MNNEKYKLKIIDSIDTNLDLHYFKNVVFRYEENTLYENDDSDIFVFFNWNILTNSDYNENISLDEFITKNNLSKITGKKMLQFTNNFYSSRLDRKVIQKLKDINKLKVKPEDEILSSVEKIDKVIYLYSNYNNNVILELNKLIRFLNDSNQLSTDSQQIRIVYRKEDFIYFGDIDRNSIDLNDVNLSIQISTHPDFTVEKTKNTFEFKSKSNHNYIEFTNESKFINDGINKSIGVILELSQLVEMIYDKTETIYSDNVRLFVSNPYVDSSIINTLLETPKIFHVLHNGVALVCNKFLFSCDSLILEKTNIVNGAQTLFNVTKLIKFGIIDLDFLKDKYIFAKIIEVDSTKSEEMRLKISQAANTQKAINLQDLKSNHKFLINYKNLFSLYSIDLIIKRGAKTEFVNKIKVDKFAKIVYSALYQMPGFARNASLKKFYDETDDYFKETFNYFIDNELNNRLRVFVTYIYFKYLEIQEQINKKIGKSQKYIELYYVAYIFGNLYLKKKVELESVLEKEPNFDDLKIFDEDILKLTDDFSRKIKKEIKQYEKVKSLFNIYKSDELYISIFPETKRIAEEMKVKQGIMKL